MKKSFLIFLSLAVGSLAFAKEPMNIETYRQTLVRYHDSGEYEKDMDKVANRALQYLTYRLSKPMPNNKKPAVVFDIDETSLSNYPDMLKLGFGNTANQVLMGEKEGNDEVIKPTLKLYRFAKENHLAIFFITGRHEEERANTEKNLRAAGFDQWDKLVLRDGPYETIPAATYKTAIRKGLSDQGYDILLNIGDQQSDLVGRYADKTFKLPNPYYLIP